MQYEKWKRIKGFQDRYWVSSFGRVKRVLPNGDIKFLALSPNKNRNNYIYVNLETPTERRNWSLHRLVAEYFIPNLDNKPCVNHIDCNVSNNAVTNLEWVTFKENSAHAKRLGRMAHQFGELCGNHKLKEKTVIAIIEERNKNHTSYNKIAKQFQTNYSNVAHIFRGSRWNHLYHLIDK